MLLNIKVFHGFSHIVLTKLVLRSLGSTNGNNKYVSVNNKHTAGFVFIDGDLTTSELSNKIHAHCMLDFGLYDHTRKVEAITRMNFSC